MQLEIDILKGTLGVLKKTRRRLEHSEESGEGSNRRRLKE